MEKKYKDLFKRSIIGMTIAILLVTGRLYVNTLNERFEDRVAFEAYTRATVMVKTDDGDTYLAARMRDGYGFGEYVHSPVKLGDIVPIFEYDWHNYSQSVYGHRFVYYEADIEKYIVK